MFLIILLFFIFTWINYDILIMICCKYINTLSFKINLYCYFLSILWSVIILYFDLYILNVIFYLILYVILDKKRD